MFQPSSRVNSCARLRPELQHEGPLGGERRQGRRWRSGDGGERAVSVAFGHEARVAEPRVERERQTVEIG